MKRRAYFDPRATEHQFPEVSEERINRFVANLTANTTDTLWQRHLSINYAEEQYTDEDLINLDAMRNMLLDNLRQIPDGSVTVFEKHGKKVYEIPNTRGQRASSMWSHWRGLHVTSSIAYTVQHLVSAGAKMHFLQKHMWGLHPVKTKEMKYGIKNEINARKAYEEHISKKDSTAVLYSECPMMKHEDNPEHSCSADSIVFSSIYEPKLAEYKCPYTLRKQNPKHYKNILTPEQLRNFCIGEDKNGNYLKRSSPYYHQVQHTMGVLQLKECDFVIWTDVDIMIIPVSFDENFWNTMAPILKKVHRELLMPEYFLMRTPRNLHPIEME